MIILTCDPLLDNASLTAIASVMLNFEAGTATFAIDGTINDNPVDYHQFTHDDVTYSVCGLYYTLIICSSNPIDAEFLNRLAVKCRLLENKYLLKNPRITHPSYLSMDYTAAYTVSDVSSNTRLISFNDFDLKTKNIFHWRVIANDDVTTYFQERSGIDNKVNRNSSEFKRLVEYSTIIADLNNIFIPTALTITTPTFSLYTLAPLCVSETPIDCDESTGQLSRATALACSLVPINYNTPLLISSFTNRTTSLIALIPLPIYDEIWLNIRPRRYLGNINAIYADRIDSLIHGLTNSSPFDIAELEEEKNVDSGAPPSRADLCHCCLMYLYNQIYVLETLNDAPQNKSIPTHTCVCALCLHTTLYPVYAKKIAKSKTTILKVTYPRTHHALLTNPLISRLSAKHSLLLSELMDTNGLRSKTFDRIDNRLTDVLLRATPTPPDTNGFYMVGPPKVDMCPPGSV